MAIIRTLQITSEKTEKLKTTTYFLWGFLGNKKSSCNNFFMGESKAG